jgi:hypothetical protein
MRISSTGAATFSSSVTSNVNDGSAGFNSQPTTTTNSAYNQFLNADGYGYIGKNSSAGGNLAAGSAAYALVVSTYKSGGTTAPIQFAPNNSVAMTITSGGDVYIGDTTSINSTRLHVKSTVNRVTALTTTQTVGAAIEYYANTSTLVGYLGNGSFLTTGAAATDFILRSENALAFNTNGNNERMRITSGGNVLIGTTTDAGYKLDVNAGGGSVRFNGTIGDKLVLYNSGNNSGTNGIYIDSDIYPAIRFNNRVGYAGTAKIVYNTYATGYGPASLNGSFIMQGPNALQFSSGGDNVRMTIDASGNIGAPTGTNIYNASDLRLKRNITTITDGLDKILNLNPVKFNWIENYVSSEENKDMFGFIAQEIQKIIPEAVESFADGNLITVGNTIIDNPLRVNEKFIIPILVKAIQELSAKITQLENK